MAGALIFTFPFYLTGLVATLALRRQRMLTAAFPTTGALLSCMCKHVLMAQHAMLLTTPKVFAMACLLQHVQAA
jgi:hypothetical protein